MSVAIPSFPVACLEPLAHSSFLTEIRLEPAVELVRLDRSDPEGSLERLGRCKGLYLHSARDEVPPWLQVTAELLRAMPRLRLVSTYGVGYDTIDVAAATAAGVAVVNQVGGNAEAVAEHALAMMLALLKRLPEAEEAVRKGHAGRREAFMGRELAGRTVGLVGLGAIGTRVAAMLRVFGCKVFAVDPALDAATCQARGAEKTELLDLLHDSEIVSLHCPLTAETRGMLDARHFAMMRPRAILVSTARGEIHDEEALADCLESGHLAGAGLDVWTTEPPSPQHRLLSLPNVVATSHTAGLTGESRERVGRMAAQSFIAAARGEPLPRQVNVLPPG